jgi:integrase/recombinase XerD
LKTYLELSEVQLLESQADNLRDRLFVRILFRLGCRVSEALGLTAEDVDLQRAIISIRHLKVRLRLSCPECAASLGRSHSFCPKCGVKVNDAVARELEHRRQRTLPIDSDTLAMLEEYIRRGGPVEKNGKTLVFGINRHRAWQIVRECAERAGLPKLVNPETGKLHGVSPHKLRDAFAVHAVKINDSGDGLRMLQEHLGHQSFNTTAKYRKVSGEEHKEWYSKLWEKSNP